MDGDQAEPLEQCQLLDTAGTTAQAVPVHALPLPATAHITAAFSCP